MIDEVLGEVEPGVSVVVFGEAAESVFEPPVVLGEPLDVVVVFGEVVVGNESLFEAPVVPKEPLDVVVFVLLLATSCLNRSPKLCA